MHIGKLTSYMAAFVCCSFISGCKTEITKCSDPKMISEISSNLAHSFIENNPPFYDAKAEITNIRETNSDPASFRDCEATSTITESREFEKLGNDSDRAYQLPVKYKIVWVEDSSKSSFIIDYSGWYTAMGFDPNYQKTGIENKLMNEMQIIFRQINTMQSAIKAETGAYSRDISEVCPSCGSINEMFDFYIGMANSDNYLAMAISNSNLRSILASRESPLFYVTDTSGSIYSRPDAMQYISRHPRY